MIALYPSTFLLLSVATAFTSVHGQLSNSSNSTQIAAAWFAGYHAENATPSFAIANISWSKYTQLTYSFAEPTEDTRVITLNGSSPELLPQFVQAAHENGVKASVSIGGWAGSRFWSSSVGSAENRTTFVKTVTDFATQYELDGLDFDWEYPNHQGLGCNTINANDTANFLAFIQELRAHPVGANLTLSAATAINPFMNSTGSPSSDVSEFSKVLDFIAIMNYDIWGSWSASVGPNAPLNDSCADSANQQGSAVSAVKAWNAAGMPLNQIVLGVAAYGHSFSVNTTAALVNSSNSTLAPYPAFNASAFPLGDSWDDAAGTLDACGALQTNGGTMDFWALIQQGYLDSEGNFKSDIPHRFDSCSQTPYVYNPDTGVMVSFDNADSFSAKGKFIKDTGLAGFAMWEAGGDFDDILVDAIREGAEFDDEEDC